MTMERTETKLRLEQLYTLAFLIFVVSKIVFGSTHLPDLLGEGVVEKIADGLLLCTLALLCLVALFYPYPQKGFVAFGLCGALLAASYLKSRASNLFLSFLFVYFSSVLRHKKRFARTVIGAFSAILALMTALSVSGLIGMTIKLRASNDATRYSLGFTHANQVALMVFVIICMLFYCETEFRRGRAYGKYILSGALALVTFIVTNTFSFLALTLLLIMASFAYDAMLSRVKLPPRDAKRFIRVGLLIMLAIVLAVVCYFWKNPYRLSGALKTFRTRFLLSQKYIKAYGIKPFGSKIIIGEDVEIPGFKRGYYFLDNGYIRLFVEYGLLAGALVMLLLARTVWNLVRAGKWQLLIIALCLMVYLFSEQKIMTVFFNPFWLLLRDYMLPRRRARVRVVSVA